MVTEEPTRRRLIALAEELDGRDAVSEFTPLEAAAVSVSEDGLEDALANAQRDAEQFRTAWHDEVLAILEAVYETDPRQPNDCAECGRSFGPNYIGPCEH